MPADLQVIVKKTQFILNFFQHTFSISDTGEDIFSIEIVGTIHKAIICPSFVENGIEWMLTVHFK